MLLWHRTICVTLILAAAPAAACAQERDPFPRRSQRGSVMQMVARTRIEITYSRPVARGRELFGGLVPYGRIWNPGADTATAISVSEPVQVNGQRLEAGSYSIWAIPGEKTWTIIFSRATPIWHIPYPQGQDALRVESTPTRSAHLETLTWHFPLVEGYEATLALHWGELVVPLSLKVER